MKQTITRLVTLLMAAVLIGPSAQVQEQAQDQIYQCRAYCLGSPSLGSSDWTYLGRPAGQPSRRRATALESLERSCQSLAQETLGRSAVGLVAGRFSPSAPHRHTRVTRIRRIHWQRGVWVSRRLREIFTDGGSISVSPPGARSCESEQHDQRRYYGPRGPGGPFG